MTIKLMFMRVSVREGLGWKERGGVPRLVRVREGLGWKEKGGSTVLGPVDASKADVHEGRLGLGREVRVERERGQYRAWSGRCLYS